MLKEFNGHIAPWLHPSNLTVEGLPQPSGFALSELTGSQERVRAFSNELGQWQRQEMEEAKAFAKRTRLPLVWRIPHTPPSSLPSTGNTTFPGVPVVPSVSLTLAVMVEVVHGQPVYLATANTGAADTIGTDELWSINLNRAMIQGLSGLNLNGEGTQLALWNGGAILTNNQEFVITNSSGMKSS